ncbi:GntR family transcriptional regulator [Tissierella sp. Yu-01]|uniref:GntR family transcriptional regulator n=1 Tax=Tissierella sp. Yu-01 TaxID=3035694 RepID=UPI00240D0F9A|nr:GntR family transcriptional regulator [Tissierella sp. Yu-01]WFA08137.1 GntR family transcriptional regulator [Tissierella sp. Yu-01]
MKDYINEVIKLTDLKQNKPINEIVYEGLRTAIIKGIIPVGERIKETEYSERMNISRTPIREAIKRIEDEGLVEYIPNIGVIVKKVSKEDVEEIFKIRIALETLATTSAMKIMTESEFEEMHQLLKKTEEANSRNEVKAVIDLFSEYNQMIYRFSRMPRLDHMVTRLRDYLARFRDISLTGEARRRKALDEHWIIYNIMKDKNYDVVPLIISNHLDYAKSYIMQEIEKIEKK